MPSFLKLISCKVLPWRYRISIAADLATILELIHQGSEDNRHKLSCSDVRIDQAYRAYYKIDELNMNTETNLWEYEMLQFGLILCLIITGGSIEVDVDVEQNGLSEVDELAISKLILPGCHPLLEAIVYQCLDIPEERPRACDVASELKQLLATHCPPGICSTLSLKLDDSDEDDINDDDESKNESDLESVECTQTGTNRILPIHIQEALQEILDTTTATSISNSNDTTGEVIGIDTGMNGGTLSSSSSSSSSSSDDDDDEDCIVTTSTSINININTAAVAETETERVVDISPLVYFHEGAASPLINSPIHTKTLSRLTTTTRSTSNDGELEIYNGFQICTEVSSTGVNRSHQGSVPYSPSLRVPTLRGSHRRNESAVTAVVAAAATAVVVPTPKREMTQSSNLTLALDAQQIQKSTHVAVDTLPTVVPCLRSPKQHQYQQKRQYSQKLPVRLPEYESNDAVKHLLKVNARYQQLPVFSVVATATATATARHEECTYVEKMPISSSSLGCASLTTTLPVLACSKRERESVCVSDHNRSGNQV
jgi:hypothetical protein